MFVFIAGEYVASGSDDGRWFIWEKKTGRLIKILVGDENGTIALVSMYSGV
jgi:WD and tetratricopeptide repeat-containing protein 1